MDTIYINEKNNKEEKLELVIQKDTNIFIYNKALKKIEITALDNCNIFINEFNIQKNNLTEIIFNIQNNSHIKYNCSNIIEKDYNLNININYNGNNSNVETNIHSIVKGYEYINLKGIIKNNAKNNELLENVKIMLIDQGQCEVNPDMYIDTKEVNANHLVAISNIRNQELFYLMSKGLSEHLSIELIKRSFLISNITNKEFAEKIKKEL